MARSGQDPQQASVGMLALWATRRARLMVEGAACSRHGISAVLAVFVRHGAALLLIVGSTGARRRAGGRLLLTHSSKHVGDTHHHIGLTESCMCISISCRNDRA